MNDGKTADPPRATAQLRAALKSQYHAALAMLRQAVEHCPDGVWEQGHRNECWQVAYHTLFFAHLYSQVSEAAWQPWEHHQADNQYEDAIAGPPDPKSKLPLLPRPYTKAEVLAYWEMCDRKMDEWVDALDLESPHSGFSWYKMSKIEHQILNVRHIQHGAAQIADRVRTAADVGTDWVGAGRGKRT